MKKSLLLLATTFILASGAARGQAFLSFSGGNGSPLALTLTQPLTYTITIGAPIAPFFVFLTAQDVFANSFPLVTGNITFTINGGAPLSIAKLNSGHNGGTIASTDIYMIPSALPGVGAGDVITLSSGTLTTNGNIAAAPPTNFAYNSFLTDNLGNPNSTAGLAVPEPASSALLGAGALGVLFLVRRPGRFR